MKLSRLHLLILRSLYDAPDLSGDVVELVSRKKNIYTVHQVQEAGEELEQLGLIMDYRQTQEHADATLSDLGIDYIEDNT